MNIQIVIQFEKIKELFSACRNNKMPPGTTLLQAFGRIMLILPSPCKTCVAVFSAQGQYKPLSLYATVHTNRSLNNGIIVISQSCAYHSRTWKHINQSCCCIDVSENLRFSTVSANLVQLHTNNHGREAYYTNAQDHQESFY